MRLGIFTRLGILMRLGTYCRGGPPWPPLRGINRGAATEGRPYSTFYLIVIVIEYVEGLSPDSTRMR